MKQLTLFDEKVFRAFVPIGDVVEVRIVGAFGKSSAWSGYAKGIVAGYFDDYETFCKAVKEATKSSHSGIYFSLHRIDPRLIGRAFNRLKAGIRTTADNNVLAYRWLPVDTDPVRPSGISASDAELKEALLLRDEIARWVCENLELPSPIRAVSGNGGHLLFRLPDLPVSDENQNFIRNTLNGLANRFDTDKVLVDTSVFNPARIWKFYGTTARKGDEVPAGEYREARPHRISFMEEVPDDL